MREPLDDPTDTHGICDRHQQALFEGFPSSSFPSTRWLFIVPSHDASGYTHLAKILANVPGATVILDRRRGERRQSAGVRTADRRQADRRVRRPEVTSLGYRLVRFAVTSASTAVPVGAARAGRPGTEPGDAEAGGTSR